MPFLQITEQHCASVKISLHCNCGCILACTTDSLWLNIMWYDLIFPKKCICHMMTSPLFFFHCRVDPVQKSCSLFGLFLLGVSGRLYLPCINSCLCSGGLLPGVRVNIHCQLRPALHQCQTKEGNWRNEGEDGLKWLTCEIQHFFLISWAGALLDLRDFVPQYFHFVYTELFLRYKKGLSRSSIRLFSIQTPGSCFCIRVADYTLLNI